MKTLVLTQPLYLHYLQYEHLKTCRGGVFDCLKPTFLLCEGVCFIVSNNYICYRPTKLQITFLQNLVFLSCLLICVDFFLLFHDVQTGEQVNKLYKFGKTRLAFNFLLNNIVFIKNQAKFGPSHQIIWWLIRLKKSWHICGVIHFSWQKSLIQFFCIHYGLLNDVVFSIPF